MQFSTRLFDPENGCTYIVRKTVSDEDLDALKKWRSTITTYIEEGLTVIKETDAPQWRRNGYGINGDRPDGTKIDHWATSVSTMTVLYAYIKELTDWGATELAQHGLVALGFEGEPLAFATEAVRIYADAKAKEERQAEIDTAKDIPDFKPPERKYTCIEEDCEAKVTVNGFRCPDCHEKHKTVHDEAAEITAVTEKYTQQGCYSRADELQINATALRRWLAEREKVLGVDRGEWHSDHWEAEMLSLNTANRADLTRQAVMALDEAHERNINWDFDEKPLSLAPYGDDRHVVRKVDGQLVLHSRHNIDIRAHIGAPGEEGWQLKEASDVAAAIQSVVELNYDYLPERYMGDEGEIIEIPKEKVET